MSSSLPLFLLNPRIHLKPPNLFSPALSPSSSLKSHTFKSLVCFASSDSSHQDTFWLREEQRWLREEQRWLREEQRWARERDSLLRRIDKLELQVQALERQKSVQDGAEVSETIANIAGLLQVLKEKNRIAETGSGPNPIVLGEKIVEQPVEEKEVVVEQVVRVVAEEGKKTEEKKTTTLRMGSEGAEVRAMQVCFCNLKSN